MRAVALLLLLTAPALHAQPPEDEAHRLDRLRTEQLNREAGRAAGDRDDAAMARYRDARADYEAALRDWRRRVADCRAGDDRACMSR